MEVDQRYAELIIEELSLKDSKGLAVPGVAETADTNDAQLSDDQSSRYRSIAARMNDLAQGRMDILLSIQEVCRCR